MTDSLRFDPGREFSENILTFPDGKTVKYRLYENLYYVTNVEDPECQFLNMYVPEAAYGAKGTVPVFLRTYAGGYRAAKQFPSRMVTDASGRALQEDYVVVIPNSRGWDSKVTKDGREVFTGRAPASLTDLKAAVRYLRHNRDIIPGNTERIITDGTSAGGAMSALLGATGNNPEYEPYLAVMGAAKERDDIFAAVCFCPITDLEHADMAYEWLYNRTNAKSRGLSPEQITISDELAALYPSYLDSLKLKTPDGTTLTGANYLNYLKSFLIQSAQKARDAGAEIPPDTGITVNVDMLPWAAIQGNFVLDIDLDTYLNYIPGRQQLKTPPAFDQMGVLVPDPSFENMVFGDETGNAVNFSDFSAKKRGSTIDAETVKNVHLFNPMDFICDGKSTVSQNWYIRHGMLDKDTSFQVSVNLYTRLINSGCNADFALSWNRIHTGDYDLTGLFGWINSVIKTAEKII